MSDPAQQSWLNAIYTAVYNRHEDYYEDSVTMLSLLAMSGNFWDPTVIGGPGPASHWVYLPVLLKS
jgi:hypothetical protein